MWLLKGVGFEAFQPSYYAFIVQQVTAEQFSWFTTGCCHAYAILCWKAIIFACGWIQVNWHSQLSVPQVRCCVCSLVGIPHLCPPRVSFAETRHDGQSSRLWIRKSAFQSQICHPFFNKPARFAATLSTCFLQHVRGLQVCWSRVYIAASVNIQHSVQIHT